MVAWYRRLGDIQGLDYTTPAGINRARLPRHDARPEVRTYTFDGKREQSLWWPAGQGGSSASPAHERAFDTQRDAPTRALLRRLYETLELPGIASDYHFALLNAYEALWGRRRDEPDVLQELERLCWLDLRLIEALPDTIIADQGGEPVSFHVPAFGHLIALYEREGALREALDVAERAERFGQQNVRIDDLRRRLAALEAEDAA